MQMCFIFLLLFIFNSFSKNACGMDAVVLLYFAKIQWIGYIDHDRRLWI